MNTIIIDGIEYHLVPKGKKAGDIKIIEINGVSYYMGIKNTKLMTWEEAKEWVSSLGEEYMLPDRILALACAKNPDIVKIVGDAWAWTSEEFYNGNIHIVKMEAGGELYLRRPDATTTTTWAVRRGA